MDPPGSSYPEPLGTKRIRYVLKKDKMREPLLKQQVVDGFSLYTLSRPEEGDRLRVRKSVKNVRRGTLWTKTQDLL